MYIIKKDVVRGGHYVQRTDNRKVVFFGTKTECEEWMERNGHDGDV